jgi:ceramide glucosyltransferase
VITILIALAVLSIILNIWQWGAGATFPLHRRSTAAGFAPPLSVLKPLKGCDSETEACLESWFRQGYPAECELLFAVASRDDPVCAILHKLMVQYPRRTARMVLAQPILGPNAKVSSLCHLFKEARHEHVILSDADVLAPEDFLLNLVAPLHEKTVGLVNCFYIFSTPRNLAMRLEALAVNADFWTNVLQSIAVRPMQFALGAAMATTRRDIIEMGGFEELLPLLADDYALGNRIARNGRMVEIAKVPVECRSAELSWREVWTHQLRWARTIAFPSPSLTFSASSETRLSGLCWLRSSRNWGFGFSVWP